MLTPYFEEIKLKIPRPLDWQAILEDEFVEMLCNNEPNLGKELYQKHCIISGGSYFYRIIQKAADRGLKTHT